MPETQASLAALYTVGAFFACLGVILTVVVIRLVRIEHLRGLARATIERAGPWPPDPGGTSADGVAHAILPREGDGAQAAPLDHRQSGTSAQDLAEYGAYGAVTAAAITWSLASIDPDIVAAADFASDTAIHTGFDYAQYIHAHMDGFSQAAQEGFLARLQGYVGERFVADILVDQGHTVTQAATANQPIWDLLVDGHAVNVKTVADTASILPDAAAHPDVTYIVPADAHGATAHNVLHLDGFSHDTVHQAVHESLATVHGDTAFQWLAHHIPWVTLGFSAMRQINEIEKGKPIGPAISHCLADTAGRGGGAMLFGKIGAAIGSTAGPLGMIAAAGVGAIIGSLIGGAVAAQWKLRGLKRALAALTEALHSLGATFSDRLEEIRNHLHAPLRRMEQSLRALQQHVEARKRSWRWLIWPDFQTVLLDEAAQEGRKAVERERAAVARVNAILQTAKTTGRYESIGLMLANSPVIRQLLGCADAMLEPVQQAREAVLAERRILHPELAEKLR